jgi:hypothetical protein
MTITEFLEIYKLIMDKYGWNKLYENNQNDRRIYKYVDFSLDTRDGNIWCGQLLGN